MGRPLLVWLSLCAWLGCAPATQFFHDGEHRATYGLRLDELKTVQFYLSDEILAHELGESGRVLEGPEHVYIVARGTRGAVLDGGPHWLRVSFGSGPGALFLANPDAKPDSIYLLASEGARGEPALRVKDLGDPILRFGERRFRVMHGADAGLLIDDDDLSRLIEARSHARGREVSR